MSFRNIKTVIYAVVPALLLGSCSSSRYAMREDRAPQQDINVSKIPDARPRVEARSKYGNPDSYEVLGRRYHVMKTAQGFRQRGIASWYGSKFHGHRTSSGEPYDMYAMTAAHKTLPLPSYVRVTNLDNQRSVVVRVNDRGPFHENRIIDLSYAAAKKLGITASGTGRVQLTHIDPRQQPAHSRVSAFGNKSRNKAAPDKTQPEANSQTIFLQIGAYAKRTNAEQMRRRVADVLESGAINTGYNEDNKLYRVTIGPLVSAQEADKLAEKLSQSGISHSKIIID